MNKILIIDDDMKLCKAIELFNRNIFDITYICDVEFLNLDKLGRYIENHEFDLVIFDLEIGPINGFDLYQSLAPIKNSSVIFLSGTSTVDIRIKSLQAGVDDFLCKPIDLLELQVKMQKILESHEFSNLETIGDYVIDNDLQKIYKNDVYLKLPPFAVKLLKYLLHNQDRNLTREELLENIWNYSIDDSSRLVDTNINLIRTEAKDANIVTVRGVGYRYEKIR